MSEPFAPLAGRIRAALSPDLLRPEWRGGARPEAGHCYAAAEAMYHALRAHGVHSFKPASAPCPGGVHWFLRDADGTIVDPTARQFDPIVRAEVYRGARGRGFLTAQPSKRAAEILRRIGLAA